MNQNYLGGLGSDGMSGPSDQRYFYGLRTDEEGNIYFTRVDIWTSEEGIQIYDLANLIGKLMGHEQITINVDQARVRPWEIWHLQSDNTKLYSVINKRPEVGLEEALEKTIAFYYQNNKKWDWKK
jgi:nucleoside-diphosphate-sugar epimerase